MDKESTHPARFTMQKNKEIQMLNYTDYKKIVGLDVATATDEKILDAMVKKIAVTERSTIDTALLAEFLIKTRNYSQTDAGRYLGFTGTYVGSLANKGQILRLTATEATLSTVWSQITKLTGKALSEHSAQVAAADEDKRAELVTRTAQVAAISTRLGENHTPELVDKFVEKMQANGFITPSQVTANMQETANALGVTLPKAERNGATVSTLDNSPTKVPTTRDALATLTNWETDRLAGSDPAHEFALSDEEVDQLEQIARTAIRSLGRAGLMASVLSVSEFTDLAVDKMANTVNA